MSTMHYPVLLLSSELVVSVASQAELERMLGQIAAMAERAGYWESVVLVDRDLERHAIGALELGKRPAFLSWMKRARPALRWEPLARGPVDLAWVKERAAKTLSENDFLDPRMQGDLLRAIERAPTINAVCTFLSGSALEDYRSVKEVQASGDVATGREPVWLALLLVSVAMALTVSVIGPVKTLLWQLLVVPGHALCLLARRTLPDWRGVTAVVLGWVATLMAIRMWGPTDAFLGAGGAFYTALFLLAVVGAPPKTAAVSKLIFPGMKVETVASSVGTVLLTGKDHAGAPLEILFMGAAVTSSTVDLPQGVGSGTVGPGDGGKWTIAFADGDGAVFLSITFASSMYQVAGGRWRLDPKGW